MYIYYHGKVIVLQMSRSALLLFFLQKGIHSNCLEKVGVCATNQTSKIIFAKVDWSVEFRGINIFYTELANT